MKIVCWSWNEEPRLIPIWQFWFFFFLDLKYPFRVNLVQILKIVSLSWNLVPRIFRICNIRWWCSRFFFSTFLHVSSKKSIWCCLINLPAVYLQRFEASGFSCLCSYMYPYREVKILVKFTIISLNSTHWNLTNLTQNRRIGIFRESFHLIGLYLHASPFHPVFLLGVSFTQKKGIKLKNL